MTRVSLIGDVHGDVARLTAMLDIVEAETDRMVVLLGDYVNWGPDPAGVLELLSRRQVRLGDRLVLLEGNHDRAFREFLDGGDIALLLAMGGAATVRSYIGAARGELSGRLRASVPQSHIKVLKSLQPMWCTDDLLALHQWPEDHIEIGRGRCPRPLPAARSPTAHRGTRCLPGHRMRLRPGWRPDLPQIPRR